AYRICTTQCRCYYYDGECFAPRDYCKDGFINGMIASDYCEAWGMNSTEETCRGNETKVWEVPNMCQCYWQEPSGFTYQDTFGKGHASPANENYRPHCKAPGGSCSDMGPNGNNGQIYCSKSLFKDECENLQMWSHPDANQYQLRHYYWCNMAIGFIIGPSILSNLILLIRLLYNSNHKRYTRTAGLASISNIHWFIAYLALSSMAVFQILPFMCILLKIMSTWLIYKKYINESEDSNDLKSVTIMVNIVFSLTEDIPQLMLQMMFFLRAVQADDGIVVMNAWLEVAAVITSCLSLSRNYAQYRIILKPSTSNLITFVTTFITAC
ncbi:unnamed protein product, partial [Meganyctiphanes norvegica]